MGRLVLRRSSARVRAAYLDSTASTLSNDPPVPGVAPRLSNDGGVPIFKFHADLTIAVVDGAKSAGGSPSIAPLRDLTVMNVLLADDASTIRTILKRLLVREFDYTVVEAEPDECATGRKQAA